MTALSTDTAVDRNGRLVAAALLCAAAAALAVAYGSQYLGGLHPCVLCLYQRWPWWAAAALAALALAVPHPAARRALLGLAGAALVAGAAVAGYHVGVEQRWWAGPATCGGVIGAMSLDELRAQIMSAPLVRCDVPAWSFLGISMAGFNAAASLAVGAVALAAAWRAGSWRQ